MPCNLTWLVFELWRLAWVLTDLTPSLPGCPSVLISPFLPDHMAAISSTPRHTTGIQSCLFPCHPFPGARLSVILSLFPYFPPPSIYSCFPQHPRFQQGRCNITSSGRLGSAAHKTSSMSSRETVDSECVAALYRYCDKSRHRRKTLRMTSTHLSVANIFTSCISDMVYYVL